jgi:peptidoglycan hydrolase CwlO-like protein
MWSDNVIFNKIVNIFLSAFVTLTLGAIAWLSKDQVTELRNVQIQQAGMTVELREANKNIEKTNTTLEKQENKISSVMQKQDRQHNQITLIQGQLKDYQEERRLYWKRINGDRNYAP